MDDLDVTIYSKNDCPWCDKAKALLSEKNISFKELKFGTDFSREQLAEKVPFNYNKITVPQIFFGDDHIGGYEDLEDFFKLADAIDNMTEQWRKANG
jgi:glutaredoxin 3